MCQPPRPRPPPSARRPTAAAAMSLSSILGVDSGQTNIGGSSAGLQFTGHPQPLLQGETAAAVTSTYGPHSSSHLPSTAASTLLSATPAASSMHQHLSDSSGQHQQTVLAQQQQPPPHRENQITAAVPAPSTTSPLNGTSSSPPSTLVCGALVLQENSGQPVAFIECLGGCICVILHCCPLFNQTMN